MLKNHFNITEECEVLERLNIDCRWVAPEYKGPSAKIYDDGSYEGWDGSLIRKIKNQYASYEEVAKYVLDEIETIEDIDRLLKFPNLDDYDFAVIGELCNKYEDYCIFTGMCSSFYFPTLIRPMEKILLDMVLNPELAHHYIKRCVDWHLDYHERLLRSAKGRIDVLQLADDFSTQKKLLFSIDMFRKFYKEPLKKFVELGKSYGVKIFFHCCGSAYHIIPELIEIGVEILDPVQTTTANMEPEQLKKEFGKMLTFHGAMNTQGTVPLGTSEDVRKEAQYLRDALGSDGGYILTSCHYLQPDVPLENILTMYEMENRS